MKSPAYHSKSAGYGNEEDGAHDQQTWQTTTVFRCSLSPQPPPFWPLSPFKVIRSKEVLHPSPVFFIDQDDREKLCRHLSELQDKKSEIRLQIKSLQEELSKTTEVAKGVKYSLEYLSSEESTALAQHPATPGRSQKRRIDWIVEALVDGEPKTITEIKAAMLENGYSGPTKNLSAMLNIVLIREQDRKSRLPKCVPLERDGTKVWKLNRVQRRTKRVRRRRRRRVEETD